MLKIINKEYIENLINNASFEELKSSRNTTSLLNIFQTLTDKKIKTTYSDNFELKKSHSFAKALYKTLSLEQIAKLFFLFDYDPNFKKFKEFYNIIEEFVDKEKNHNIPIFKEQKLDFNLYLKNPDLFYHLLTKKNDFSKHFIIQEIIKDQETQIFFQYLCKNFYFKNPENYEEFFLSLSEQLILDINEPIKKLKFYNKYNLLIEKEELKKIILESSFSINNFYLIEFVELYINNKNLFSKQEQDNIEFRLLDNNFSDTIKDSILKQFNFDNFFLFDRFLNVKVDFLLSEIKGKNLIEKNKKYNFISLQNIFFNKNIRLEDKILLLNEKPDNLIISLNLTKRIRHGLD